MPKTVNSVNPQGLKIELNITAALVAALAMLTTVEKIDISEIVVDVNGGGANRAVNKQYVVGSPETAILDYSKRIEQGDLGIVFLYTNGKDNIGTDNLDVGELLSALMAYTTTDLSLQVIYSLAGGNSGDEEIATSATQSYITSLSDPIGGANTSERVSQTMTIATDGTTVATVA